MTNEQINLEPGKTDGDFCWPEVADDVIRARDAVQEVAKAGKTVKEATAWMHNTMYDVLLKKAGSAKKFVEDIKALGAPEATQKLYREQLAQCAVMRDVWAPVVKSVKKNYNLDGFADYAGETLAEWWRKSEMPRETDMVLVLLHQAVFVAYRRKEADLKEIVEKDETLSEELRQSFLAALTCYEMASMERDEWWDDEEDDDELGDEGEPLADDVWKRFSSGLTPVQANLFVVMFPMFLAIGEPMRHKLQKDDQIEQLMEGLWDLHDLVEQADREKEYNVRGEESVTLKKGMTEADWTAEVKAGPAAFARGFSQLIDFEEVQMWNALVSCSKVIMAFEKLPITEQEQILKNIHATPAALIKATELLFETLSAMESRMEEPWAVMKNPEVPQD